MSPADLKVVGSVMGTLAALDREIAKQWASEVGQEALFAKLQAETAWAGLVSRSLSDFNAWPEI